MFRLPQLAVGDTFIAASLQVIGTVSITCTVLGVIEITADIYAGFTGEVEVWLGDDGKYVHSFHGMVGSYIGFHWLFGNP
jgi:hypothetical protein